MGYGSWVESDGRVPRLRAWLGDLQAILVLNLLLKLNVNGASLKMRFGPPSVARVVQRLGYIVINTRIRGGPLRRVHP